MRAKLVQLQLWCGPSEKLRHNMIQHIPEPVKAGFDMASAIVWVMAMFDHLPSMAAGMSCIWLGVQIYYFIKEKHKKFKRRR